MVFRKLPYASEALGPYGNIRLVKSEIYCNIYTGVRQVLMEVRKDIPTRIHIVGHWCFVHYRGQKRTCFQCGEEGHQKDKCPRRQSSVSAQPPAAAEAPATQNDTNNNAAPVAPAMDTVEPATSTVAEPSLPPDSHITVPASEVVPHLIQGILDTVGNAVMPESSEAPHAAAEVTAETTDEEIDRSVNRPKQKGNGNRRRSRSRSPVDRNQSVSNEASIHQDPLVPATTLAHLSIRSVRISLLHLFNKFKLRCKSPPRTNSRLRIR